MAVYYLKTVQKIPVSITRAWDFFSSPDNLRIITPASMNFKVIAQILPERVFAGQIIEYRVSPFWGIPLYWMTEITLVEDMRLFIDEQKKGPYKLWRHEHYFREIEAGVEMTDIVQYEIPSGFIGDIAHWLFVKKKVKKIFEYRFKKVEELFGKWSVAQSPSIGIMKKRPGTGLSHLVDSL